MKNSKTKKATNVTNISHALIAAKQEMQHINFRAHNSLESV